MLSVFKKLSWFFKEQWLRYLLAVTALIIASIIDVLPPKIVGMTIDEIQYQQLTPDRLTEILLFYGMLIIGGYAIMFYWDYTLFGGAILLEKKIRTKLMRHFLKMTPAFYGRNRTGDLMARATNDLKAIMMTAGFGILTLVDSTIFMMLIIGVMVFTINWKLTLAALIPLPIMAVLMNKYGKAIHKRFTKAQSAFSDLNNDVLESIKGVRVIRAFVQEKQDQKRFGEKTEDVFQKNVDVAKMDALFEPTIKILVGMAYTIGLGYGSYLVARNEITLGELVSFNVYLGMLIWPMFAAGELINVMQRGNASLDRVYKIFSQKPDVKDPDLPKEVKLPEVIEYKNVSFRYPESDNWVIQHVNLNIHRGETIGIVGKTGAGKTTLFRQLLREYPAPEKGEIQINGVPIQELSLDQTRSWIGYVPQEHILFSKTVRENLLFGCGPKSDEEIKQVLDSASLTKDIENLPEGLDTVVGESGVTLSGGQKQRVSLARALLMDPEILILDDALSAVDGKTEAKIISHLKQERKGKTTLIAAHRLSAVEHADQILVFENGIVVENGTHEELMKKNGWYKTQYDIQKMEGGGE